MCLWSRKIFPWNTSKQRRWIYTDTLQGQTDWSWTAGSLNPVNVETSAEMEAFPQHKSIWNMTEERSGVTNTHLLVIMRKSESLTLAWAKYLYLAKRPFSIFWAGRGKRGVKVYMIGVNKRKAQKSMFRDEDVLKHIIWRTGHTELTWSNGQMNTVKRCGVEWKKDCGRVYNVKTLFRRRGQEERRQITGG